MSAFQNLLDVLGANPNKATNEQLTASAAQMRQQIRAAGYADPPPLPYEKLVEQYHAIVGEQIANKKQTFDLQSKELSAEQQAHQKAQQQGEGLLNAAGDFAPGFEPALAQNRVPPDVRAQLLEQLQNSGGLTAEAQAQVKPGIAQLGASLASGQIKTPLSEASYSKNILPNAPPTERLLSPEQQYLAEYKQKNPNGTVADAIKAYEQDIQGGKTLTPEQVTSSAKRILAGQDIVDNIKVGFGATGIQNQQLIKDEITKINPNYNFVLAKANAAWFNNATTQRALRRMNLLIDPEKGTFNEAIKAAKAVANPAGTPINKVVGAAKVIFGNSQRNILNTVNALTGEEMSQIFGSQQGGQKFLELAQSISDPNQSVQQYVDNIKEMKKIVGMSYLTYAEGTPLQGKAEAIQKSLEEDSPSFMKSNQAVPGASGDAPKILSIKKIK